MAFFNLAGDANWSVSNSREPVIFGEPEMVYTLTILFHAPTITLIIFIFFTIDYPRTDHLSCNRATETLKKGDTTTLSFASPSPHTTHLREIEAIALAFLHFRIHKFPRTIQEFENIIPGPSAVPG